MIYSFDLLERFQASFMCRFFIPFDCWEMFYCMDTLQEGGPLPGPDSGPLSGTQIWLVQDDTHTDKAKDFLGRASLVESSCVRECRTSLPDGSQSQILW